MGRILMKADLRPLLLVAFALSSAHAHARPAAHRPNVLLIMTDDQGYGDLGFHGNAQIETPNLDRLARESVRLTRFYVSPVCTPTRASLMTGRYNFRTGAIDTFMGRAMLHPGEVTLAQMLGDAGYRTGIFGKWHLGDCYPLRPMDRGFQESLVHKGGGIGQPSDPPGGDHYQDPTLYHNGQPEKTTGYCSNVFTDAAIRFIEQNRDRPFFTYLAFNAPHVPLEVDEKYIAPYRAKGLDETTARVYGMVQNIDENVGRLLVKLRDLGLERDTIVIFLTDNGPQQVRYNAGLRGLKGSVYEGGIHVPCFVRWPARYQGNRDVGVIAAHIDIAPTLLAACGVKAPAGLKMDGCDLSRCLLGKDSAGPKRTLFFQWHRGDAPELYNNCAARNQRYKLVNGKELYDLQEDPTESKDIAAGKPEIVAGMRKEYESWFREVCSTRGAATFDPVPITILSPNEPETWLTAQDRRVLDKGAGQTAPGFWALSAHAGACRITVITDPTNKPGRIVLTFGRFRFEKPIAPREGQIELMAGMDEGRCRLEARVEREGVATISAAYVVIRRVETGANR